MKTIYKTSDLNLATTLLTLGCELEELDRSNPRRIQFCFLNNRNIDELAGDFWSGYLSVEPQAFCSQMKILKNRLYNS